MTNNNRDYRYLTHQERDEWERVRQEEIVNPDSPIPIRNCLFSKYPRAARHFQSLFPNQYLDTIELEDIDRIQQQLNEFMELLNNSEVQERDILNYIDRKSVV